MRRALSWLIMVGWIGVAFPGFAGTGQVVKVLPQFLDLHGRNSMSPSLYERDAYQATLRDHPERRSGMRFVVQWKAKGPMWEPTRLRLELRGTVQGNQPKELTMEQKVQNKSKLFGHFAYFNLVGKEYKDFGAVTAWRVTFWEGDKLLGEQQSFLW